MAQSKYEKQRAARKHKQNIIDIKPISSIVRRHAPASFSLGTFSMSEGYEITRTCDDAVVLIEYNTARHGSSFWAEVREESHTQGLKFIESITQELQTVGYTITTTDNPLVIKVSK